MSNRSHYKVGCDAHKHFSVFAVLDHRGRVVKRDRVDPQPAGIRTCLCRCPRGTWRPGLETLLRPLPEETYRCVEQELELLDLVQGHIDRLEARILERVRGTRPIPLIPSVPGPAATLPLLPD